MTLMLATIRRWNCPNCHKEDVTTDPRPHTRFHICPALRGLTAPMLPAGTKAKVTAIEREDYVGTEHVQLDPERGRPVMSIVTTRDEGQDAIVFAPTVRASRRQIMEETDG
jgi:hypothetical protein